MQFMAGGEAKGCRAPGLKSFQRRQQMKPSTRDEIEGKVHEVKGQVKEKAGQLTNNPDLEAEGQDEKIGGKVQKKIGQVENVLGN
jgi:uncharacterized protein YjbJ (UPF0337 family)